MSSSASPAAVATGGILVALVGVLWIGDLIQEPLCCDPRRVWAVGVLVVTSVVGTTVTGAAIAARLLGLDRLLGHVTRVAAEVELTDLHHAVLAQLRSSPGASVGGIAERVDRPRREVELAVDELVAAGLVERRWAGWHEVAPDGASAAPPGDGGTLP